MGTGKYDNIIPQIHSIQLYLHSVSNADKQLVNIEYIDLQKHEIKFYEIKTIYLSPTAPIQAYQAMKKRKCSIYIVDNLKFVYGH